jgi:type IV pilus assembly protein PilB
MKDVLTKLKDSINKDFIIKFDLQLLEQMRFVPINVKETFVYIAINPFANKEDIASLLQEHRLEAKFIQVSEDEIDELLIFVQTYFFTTEEPEEIEEPEVLEIREESIENNKPVPPIKATKNEAAPAPLKKLGELLIEEDYITEEQLIEALAESKKRSMPLGSTLYALGFITLDQLKETLQKQQGYDTVNAEQLKIQEKVINILPEDFIRANKVIPISTNGRNLVVGMVKPNDIKVLRDIVYLTGQKPRALLITHYEFQNFIESTYSHSKKETKQIIQRIEEESLEIEGEETLWEQAEREMQDSSGNVAKFVNKIITDAIEMKASDIHLEPRITNYVVRYRIDGILNQVIDIPAKVEQSVLTRFKVLARMNIAEHRRPQDGTFAIKYKGNSFDLRINTLPVTGKEKVVIRILAPAVSLSAADKSINLVGGTDEDLEKIYKMITCPHGIILTSGPTGSGKTTTLYSVLKSLNNEGVNITTIEDPVEIKIEGINQSQVNTKAGITFASCMRAILRQDPDIILVGEIRDYETLEVAISAAMTGHLVLSTVHTNSAAATVTRLIEMGAKDYLVSSTLSGVIAQRLVRKLCDDCKEEHTPTYEEAQKILSDEEEIQKLTKTTVYKKKGCKNCDFSGYSGRLGVFEIMPITKEIKKLIAIGSHDIEIEDAAIACGMKTLNQSCLGHILRGETTIDEFIRVLGIVNE